MSNPSFSVLTVSKRAGWRELAYTSLESQTVQGFQWVVIVEDFKVLRTKDYERLYQAPPKLRVSNLNASLNAGLRKIDTDYVIFYQDFIDLQPDCFEKLLDLVDDRTLVTTCTPNYDGSDDGRYTGLDKPRPCRPEEWEANVAIAPMKVLRLLGGFDVEYDNGWSWDNVNVAQRAAMLGCKFILDESNRPQLLPHEQTSKLDMPLNQQWHERTMKLIREGKKPIELSYL